MQQYRNLNKTDLAVYLNTYFVAPADSLQLTRTICRTEKICRLVMYPLDNVSYDTKRRVHSFDSRFEAPERVHSLLREQYKQDLLMY